MILGIGVDVVEVRRAHHLLERHRERFLARCFGPGEVRRAGDPVHLAGLLAAKEATFKALGAARGDGVGWRDMVVALRDARPTIELAGAAAERARRLGVTRRHLSISHDGGLAIAMVVLESADGGE